MTPVVLDASVAVAWFLPERHTAVAERLFETDRPLLAPDLLATELANAILTRTRRGLAPRGHAAAALAALRQRAQIVWFDTGGLLEAAVAMAEEKDHPVYDCVYLALAKRQSAALASFDQRLARLAQSLSIPLWAAEESP